MSSITLGDQAMKASFIVQIQDRAVDIERSSTQAHNAFNEELARRAEEVVEETEAAENGGIRNDEERKEGQKQKKRRRKRPDEPDQDEIIEDWPMGPDNDGHKHNLNIIA